MSTPPRRRRPDSRNANSDGGGWLPTIAMGLGVVVAGLGIGALVAVLMQRSSGKLAPLSGPVAVATSPASPAKSLPRPPVVIATLEPPHSYLSPSVIPSPEPTESASASEAASPPTGASPSPVPSARATAQQSSAPRPAPSRLVAAVPVPLASAVQVGAGGVAQPRISRVPSAEPTVAATAQTTPAPATAAPSVSSAATTSAAAAVTAAAESAYDEHAAAVVRRYVDALVRGDDKTAYSALGGSGGTLSEQSFIDPSARIVSLKVTRIDASNASVGCEIAAAKGHFYATYHVTAASSGPYISEHDYIKV